jgi:hypothetical protein
MHPRPRRTSAAAGKIKENRLTMKKIIALLGLAALLACSTGCATKIIDAQATKLVVSTPAGKTFEVSFPKELDAKKLDLSVDPATGIINLKADSLKSSSQGIIESASAAQADAIGQLSGVVDKLVSAADAAAK